MKVEQEDAPKLKIPAGVSPHLTQELEAIQAQIRILWRNYKASEVVVA